MDISVLTSVQEMEKLQSLRRQHHALLPPYLLRFPSAAELAKEDSQTFLVDKILNDPLLDGRRAERGYERGFWRKIIGEIEKGIHEIFVVDPSSELEVDQRLYEVLANLMVSSPGADPSVPRQSYRTFVYDQPGFAAGEERRVTLLEEQVAIQAGTTGLRTWTASLHLAHHILHTPEILSPSRRRQSGYAIPACIELGAGTGFLSILLSQLGADVFATDLDGDDDEGKQTPLARLKGNVQLNELKGSLRVESLDWTDALRPAQNRPLMWSELLSASDNESRTIVAADVIYDPDLIPALVAAIRLLLSSSCSNIAIIAATVRNPQTLDLFSQTCHSSNLKIQDLDLTPMNPKNPTFWDSALDLGSAVRIIQISRTEAG